MLALVIEQEPAMRSLVRRYLEGLRIPGHRSSGASFSVIEAASGRAALSILETVAPDLVVLNLVLPELSGYELCERLRATGRFQHVPVVAISARSMPMDRVAAEEAGVSAFVVQPFTPRQLTEQVVPLFNGSPAP